MGKILAVVSSLALAACPGSAGSARSQDATGTTITVALPNAPWSWDR
jgi:hypothetical protein